MNHKISFVIYGCGETGKQVADLLLENNQNLEAILDRNPKIQHYRGINVYKLDDWINFSDPHINICIVAMHNHYIDIKPIYSNLKKIGFNNIWNMVKFSKHWPFSDKYWLSSSFDYESRAYQLEFILSLLSDDQSKSLLQKTWSYWSGGNLEDCPDPSLQDEYVPLDVPRYPKRLRLIDCGASNGSTLNRLSKAGYEIDMALAFEPDPANFKKLVLKTKDFNLMPLPLGLWSSEIQLKFSANTSNSLGSEINANGSLTIQCTSLDSLAINFNPNLIKFDIEGSEFEALLGAKKLISKYRPYLCISVYHRPQDPLDILDLLASWKLGYRFYLRCHEYNTFGLVLYCQPTEINNTK